MKSKLSVFLFFLLVNLLFSSGHFYFYDEVAMYEVTKSILGKGDFSVPSENVLIKDKKGICYTRYGFGEALIVGRLPLFGVFVPIIPHENIKGKDGKMYPPFGIGQSIAVIPFYGVGILLSKFFPKGIEGIIKEFVVSLFNSFINALIGTIIFSFIINLGYTLKVAIFVAIIYEFFTFSFEYSKMFYAEPLITLCFIGAVYCLYKYFNSSYTERDQRPNFCLFKIFNRFTFQNNVFYFWYVFFAGILMGFGILTKIAFSISVIPIVFYIFYNTIFSYFAEGNKCVMDNPIGSSSQTLKMKNLFCLINRKLLRNLIKILLLFLFPIFISLLIVALYNFHRFGNFFETGYGDKVKFNVRMLEGLYGLLFSSGKSVFVYSPILFISILLFPKFTRKHRAEGILSLFMFIIHLLFYSKWNSWQGGFCWGPRFLLPTVPLLIIPLTELYLPFDRKKRLKGKNGKSDFSSFFIFGLLVILLFVTFFLQIIGMSVRFDYVYSHFGAQLLVNSAFEKGSVFKISVPKFIPISETFRVFKEVTKNTYKFLLSSKNTLIRIRNYEQLVNKSETRRIIDFWWIYFYFLGFRKFVFVGVVMILIMTLFCGIRISRGL